MWLREGDDRKRKDGKKRLLAITPNPLELPEFGELRSTFSTVLFLTLHRVVEQRFLRTSGYRVDVGIFERSLDSIYFAYDLAQPLVSFVANSLLVPSVAVGAIRGRNKFTLDEGALILGTFRAGSASVQAGNDYDERFDMRAFAMPLL